MAEDLFDYEDEAIEPQHKDSLFLWTILILLLIGAAFACWLGSFYVFGHPEEPRSYAILKKLKKIEQPRRFDVTAAPVGDFLTAQKVFERYSPLLSLKLQEENAENLRLYIKNYTESKKVLPYIRGKFEVIQARALTSKDLFPMGTVALLQSTDYSQVVIEHVFPATGPNLEASKNLLAPRYPFNIEKTNDVTTILNVARMADGRMLVTVVPLHYPSYALKGGVGTFACEPPLELNVAAHLPITKEGPLNDALKAYAMLKSNEAPKEETAKDVPKAPELVRLDNVPVGQTAPESGALPEPTVAVAQPVHPIQPTPRPRPGSTELAMLAKPTPYVLAPTPAPVSKAIPVKPATPTPHGIATAPRATVPPAPAVPATPAPVVAAASPIPSISPTGVPLKPFVQSSRTIAPPSESGAKWPTYAPGALPRGRTVSPSEALNLVDRAGAGERLYLVGNFVVTAKGDNKAVFRPRGEPLPPGSAMRIIAEFPAGSLPPTENEVFSRDATRAFEIKNITRADDGQTVNVEVREVTRNQ